MDELRDLWQKQEVEEVRISVEELRAKAAKFQRRIQWRNLREQTACLIVIFVFGAMCVKTSQAVPRVSYVLIIVAALYIAWHLQARGAPRSLPAEMGRANGIEFYRSELERQRNLLRSIWKWYLGPMLPGMALLITYAIVTAPPGRRTFPAVYAVVAAAFFWLVSLINQRAAERFNRQIAELDRDLPTA